jgi:hypothetical protein
MPDVAHDLRAPKMAPPESADDPYALLVVLAIVHRAVHDAQGHWSPLGAANPVQVRAEARTWLKDEREMTALIELCGLDAEPVLRRVRARLFGGTGVSAAQT